MAIAAVLVVLALLPVVLLWSGERLHGLFTRGAREREREDEQRRLANPDWVYFERHLGRSVPRALRELYADPSLLPFEASELDVTGLAPIDEKGLADSTFSAGAPVLAFAWTTAGDPIYLRPGPDEADAVYVTFHESEVERIADSVDALLALARTQRATRGGAQPSSTPIVRK